MSETLNSGGNAGGFRTEPGAHLVTHALRAEGADASEDGTGRGTPLVVATLKQRGRGATDEVMDNLVFEPRYVRNGRGAPSEIVPPLKAQSGQTGKGDSAPMVMTSPMCYQGDRVIDEDGTWPTLPAQGTNNGGGAGARVRQRDVGVRRLTPRECERLQGFPDDFTAGQADSTRYRQLGNAVCVPVAAWIARRIVEVENARHP